MEYVILNNGVKMPKLGFGVFKIEKEDCENCVFEAIKAGYRLFDTAQSYFNEEEVGSAIQKSGLPREEFFITTKVWIDNYGLEKTKESVEKSLNRLKTDYIDLVLLHQPFNDYYSAYRALEDLYKEGKIRSIGVSNFNSGRLADLIAFNEIAPQINQIETNPFHQQIIQRENMIKRNVQMSAWAPFGEGNGEIMQNPVLQEIGNKYNKSVPQVILRWLIERNIVTLVKSSHADRMRQNIDVFDFELTEDEMQKIKSLDTGASIFFDYETPETVDLFVDLIDKRKGLC